MVKIDAPGAVSNAVRSGGAGLIFHGLGTGQATHASAEMTKARPTHKMKMQRGMALPAALMQRLMVVFRRQTDV